ncbi:MAG TPA: endo-1,4-beta-xylanase [Polyangiaceae bacterium]|nr:endo-1,4-beta-xylanase [Polyangiaceae bacterium]
MGNRVIALSCLLLACACGTSQGTTGGGTSGAGTVAGSGNAGATNGSAGMAGTTGGAAPNALGGAPAASGAAGSGAGDSAGAAASGAPGTAGASVGGAGNVAGANSGGSAGSIASGGNGGANVLDATCGGMNSSATNLKDKYAGCFPIGAAVDAQSYTTHGPILKAHFNSITPENDMKFDALEPSENSFNYGNADKIVDFARSNNMLVRGHTLVWYSQNPSWLFSNGSGGTVSKDTLLARMKNHIKKVMQHYQGKLYAWDVVNEAMMDDGSYRTGTLADDKKSRWYEIIGPSYIAEAFRAAHEADPSAKLFYNDFYDYIPAKHEGIYNMLKGLLADGVPVHGVGMQCHLNIEPSTKTDNQAYYQSVENLEKAIQLYSSLGLEVQVTEMDVSLYIPGVTYDQSTFYTAATFTEALQTEQANRYKAFFELFRRHRDVITGVTLWGIADDNTWLSEFSSGRKDFPLLFDTNHMPKKAYDAVMNF